MLQQFRQSSSIFYRITRNIVRVRWICQNGSHQIIANQVENEGKKEQTQKPILTMFTKDNCSLCDDAKTQLEELYEGLFELKEVDITAPENKEWFDKYKYDIPVFHFDGEYLMRHKLHEGLLEKTLKDFKMKLNNEKLIK